MKIELTHDILAKKVGQKVSAEDKKQRKIEKLIHDLFERNAELDREDLERIDPYLDKLLLTSEEINYIAENRKRIKKKQRRLLITGLLIGSLLILLSAIAFIYFQKVKQDKITLKERKEESMNRLLENMRKNTFLQMAISSLEQKERENAEKKQKIEEVKQKQKALQTEYTKSKEESEKRSKQLADEKIKLNDDLKILSKELAKIEKEEEEKKLAEAKKVLTRKDGKPKEWSSYLGEMNWNEAVKKCQNLDEKGWKDWRLPTDKEYRSILKVNRELVEKWRSEGWYYWTKDEDLNDDGIPAESAYYFDTSYGYGYVILKEDVKLVRCIR